ncbi:hypothetical protein JTB14_017667 [Gonioctena quinquepunctata]|nr:hypothetical protein JTB14_017667 [Gonioctena quinquepunctata]
MSTKVGTPQLRKNNGSITNNNQEVAQMFANTFWEAFTRKSPGTLPAMNHQPINYGSLTNIEFTPEIINLKLRCSDTNEFAGPNELTPTSLKDCSYSLSYPLSLIMTQSFDTATRPSDWKMAVIKPIYKEGDKLNPKNFRHVSLISIVAKVMQSIIADSMREFLQSHRIIPEQQHGFISNKSISSNMLCCLNDWTKSIDNGCCVDVIYLDLGKLSRCQNSD